MTEGARYERLVEAVVRTVQRTVPPGSCVAVVSRGDNRLAAIDGVEAWHFPRRADGVHAGHHPADGAAAVRHLELLRAQGVSFFVLPNTESWWLDYYDELRDYLEVHGQVVVADPDSALVIALSALEETTSEPAQAEPAPPNESLGRELENDPPHWRDLVPPEIADDIPLLFNRAYYERRTGERYADHDAALLHYLTVGHARGLDPHPLVDGASYLARCPMARSAGAVPLVHFLLSGGRQHEIGTYFDTPYYVSQVAALPAGVNPIIHFLRGSRDDAARPNPLFVPRFYASNAPGYRQSPLDPLTHYLMQGAARSFMTSPVQRAMHRQLLRAAPHGLLRGRWESATVLFLTDGNPQTAHLIAETAERLADEHHCESLVVALRRFDDGEALVDRGRAHVLFLEDYEVDCDVLRPSAVRLFVRSLLSVPPSFAVVDVPELLPVITREGVPSVLLGDALVSVPSVEVSSAVALAERVVVSSPPVVDRLADRVGDRPVNAVVRPRGIPGRTSQDRRLHAEEIVDVLAAYVPSAHAVLSPPTQEPVRPRVVIPCSDWNVSGVNASLHALGSELRSRGWDVEIVFTRDSEYVEDSAGGPQNLPSIPYRFLTRRWRGVEGMWQALIADVESRAPCVLFMAYDFIGNSAVPAFSNRVGVVAWVQSDDGDYYEQAYRLGRYCNAIVCVSTHIRDELVEMNPAFALTAHVIHNASVWHSDVVTKKARSADRLRIVYTGRLVQYQKRVLDFVDLAEALDRDGTPYSITLIGDFVAGQDVRDRFTSRAREHLADGRIVLAGRCTREQILTELSRNDFFVLLSDFEGLPLSLVEAMARGCVPVVAEMDSGIPELVTCGENGLIIPGRDYGAWAARLLEVWADAAAYRRLSRNARLTIRDGFTVERAAGQFDDLFRTVLEHVSADKYERPRSLHWGRGGGAFGDVLPPPSMHRTIQVRGLS